MSMFDSVNHTCYLDGDGIVESVQPFEKMTLETSLGPLVPIYDVDDHGRQKLTPVKLHKNGRVKSMGLQEATVVNTPIGPISAELVTFYENGAVRRVFPLNGKLSGYWTETNEYKLAETLAIPTPIGTVSVKPIYVQFHETGELKSVLMWPLQKLTIQTPVGPIRIKSGFSFYTNGALASCEPDTPVWVETPLGPVEAHDPDPNGLTETHSLTFTEQGKLAGLSTIKTVVNSVESGISFSPSKERSMCSDTEFVIRPLKIGFHDEVITFRNGLRPRKQVSSAAQLTLAPFVTDVSPGCAKCSL